METIAVTNPIPDMILIGPTGVGKSTVGRLLAQHFQTPQISMDRAAGPYLAECGLSRALWDQIEQEQNFFAAWQHWWPAFAHSVERLLADHPHGIIDFGAAHTHYEDKYLFQRVQQALAPYEHVILLLPSPDLDRSVHIFANGASKSKSGAGKWLNTTGSNTG